MIEMRDVSVHLGPIEAIRSASLSIAAGDQIGLVGESGCGKSMMALTLMGMLPDAARVSGSIRLHGEELVGLPERALRRHRARSMAMIFQEPMAALNPLRRIGDTVMEPLLLHERLPKHLARDRALALFEEVGIPDPELRLRQYPHEISGGQRQRVLIALALACNPALLIADEPTTALDANVALRITELLAALARDRKMALLFISHDLAAVARATREICVMYAGDIVERGPTLQVLDRPVHPYTRGLLGARPRFDPARPRRQRMLTIPGSVPRLMDLAPGCRFSGRCVEELPHCASVKPGTTSIDETWSVNCHRRSALQPDGMVRV